jgi:hypothetical protein
MIGQVLIGLPGVQFESSLCAYSDIRSCARYLGFADIGEGMPKGGAELPPRTPGDDIPLSVAFCFLFEPLKYRWVAIRSRQYEDLGSVQVSPSPHDQRHPCITMDQ